MILPSKKYLISILVYWRERPVFRRGRTKDTHVAHAGARLPKMAKHCFGSARRLGIRIWYKADLPLEEQLDIWPPLPNVPIAIWADSGRSHYDDNNIISALEHNSRICRIELSDISCSETCSEMESVLAAMHRLFPALTYLRLARGLTRCFGRLLYAFFFSSQKQYLYSRRNLPSINLMLYVMGNLFTGLLK